jgi:hypothetical protein
MREFDPAQNLTDPKAEDADEVFQLGSITRRALLKVGSTLAATPVVSALAAADSSIHLSRSGADFSIIYGKGSWTCRLKWFGAKANHDLKSNISIAPDGGPVEINIRRVRFPGTDLGFDVNLRVGFVDGRPAITFAIRSLRVEQQIGLVDWLSGVEPFAGELSGKQTIAFVTALDRYSITASGRTSLKFFNNGSFQLVGADAPFLVKANSVSIAVDLLHIAIGFDAQPEGFDAFNVITTRQKLISNFQPSQDVTLVWSYSMGGPGGEFARTKNVAAEVSKIAFSEIPTVERPTPTISVVLGNLSPTSGTYVAARSFTFDCRIAYSGKTQTAKQHVKSWPDFKVESAVLTQIAWGHHSRAWLTGSFRPKATYNANGHVPVVISGRNVDDFTLESVDETLTAFAASAELNHAFVSMRDADYSRVDFEGTELHYALEELTPINSASAVAAGYMLAFPPVFSARLGERAIVRVTRTTDLLALKYSFRDIFLLAKPGEAIIDSCENCVPGFKLAPGHSPLMVVRFPPQHIVEKAFLRVGSDTIATDLKQKVPLQRQRLYETPKQDGTINGNGELANIVNKLGNQNALDDNIDLAREDRDPDAAPDATTLFEALDHVVEARMAGPTRLVFAFDPLVPLRLLPRPFSVSALTDWKGLTAKVAARALLRNASLLDQLRISGISETTPTIEKTYVIDRSLAPPDPESTVIEFPYRLQLSPAEDARWQTSPAPTEDRIAAGVTLWAAQLDPELGGRSVRALWSPDFDAARVGFFLNGIQPPHTNDLPWRRKPKNLTQSIRDLFSHTKGQMRMSTDARDRHELVLLSSVYGLPALLPVPDPNVFKPDNQRAESTVFPLPPGFPQAAGQLGKEGVFSPQPLASAQIVLSSLGATVDLKGQWEPPSGFTMDGQVKPLWPALTVERWHHMAFLGRDVFVEVVYKGFIFPLGHRCAVVKSTERKFLPDPRDNCGKAPVAYLIQRYFVVVGEPKKSFPAVGQRFGGRALYATAVTMLTTKSPDIVPPFQFDLRNNGTPFGSAGGVAFFPKTQPGHGLEGAVQFEYQTEYADGTLRKLKGPLIVVDNTLAHDAEGIHQLVEYYNASGTNGDLRPGRTADSAGQKLRYAEEKSPGSTEFVTRDWLLGAIGRAVDPNAPPLFEYTMDAVMEGADQPPFYPFCAEAQVEVQSLNYMNGKSQGYTLATYDLNYLQNGFSAAKNPSGIFFGLPERDGNRTDLSLDDNTAASGGFATPNMKVVFLSREKGPVGGTSAPKQDLASTLGKSAVAKAKANPPSSSDLDLSHAQQGQFDPLEALAGALKLPKLFGIIPLQSLIPILSFIDGAPAGIESTIYKITDNIEEFAAQAREVARQIRKAIDGATGDLNRNLAIFSNTLGLTQPILIDNLYPKLAGAFKQLSAALVNLEAAAGNFNPAYPKEAFASLSETAAAINATLAETKAVARHPAPNIDRLVAQISDALKAVGDGLRTAVQAEIKSIVEELTGALNFTVTFKRPLPLKDGTPGTPVTMTVGETTTVIADFEANPLYQFLVVALTGRPDTWAVVEGQQILKLTFDVKNYASLSAQGASQAAATAADQLLNEALLYDSVSKPIIDGYILINQLAASFDGKSADFEKQLHDLPEQLTLVLLSWLEGALGLERLFGLTQAFLANKDQIQALLKEALETYVDPLVSLPDATTRAADIDYLMAGVLAKINEVVADPAVLPGTKAAISQSRIKLAKLRLRLNAALDDYDGLRKQFTPPPSVIIMSGDFDKVRPAVAGALGKLFSLQMAALAALNDTIAASLDTIDDVLAAQPFDAQWLTLTVLAEVEQASIALIDGLVVNIAAFPQMPTGLQAVFDVFDAAVEITNTASLVVVDAKQLRDLATKAKATNPSSTADVKALADQGRKFLVDAGRLIALFAGDQRALSGLATRGLMLGQRVVDEMDKQAFAKVKPAIVKALAVLTSDSGAPGIYQIAETVRQTLDPTKGWLTPDIAAILKLFLTKNMLTALEALSDSGSAASALKTERGQIAAVQTSIASSDSFGNLDHKAVNDLIRTIRAWSTGNPPGPALVLQPVQQVADLLLKGKLADLINLNDLEKALEDALLSFIPAQVSFDYDWGVPLKSFPSETSKLFWIDQERKAEPPGTPFAVWPPFKDKVRKPAYDLTIYVRAGVDFRVPTKPKPILQAEADIRYCDINLFGPNFDVVTVNFDQIHFTVDENGSDFHVQLASDPVEFGPVVGYIQDLASVFGGDSGLYLHPAFNPLGIIVGYRYAQDEIPLGTLSLLNFAIDLSVQLSFDNTPVSFRLALAERDKPLTIICTPYGGAGYIALRTIASDIVGFEMQLEFGGAAALSFPPLSAHGFVSAGIYIEMQKGQALILEGFVRAIGEGSIVCFSISVFFEVRIHQQGSNVTGELTVSVSFKVGFVKITYTYKAEYAFAGKSGGGNSHLLARAEKIHVDVANRQNNWKKYRGYFALQAA